MKNNPQKGDSDMKPKIKTILKKDIRGNYKLLIDPKKIYYEDDEFYGESEAEHEFEQMKRDHPLYKFTDQKLTSITKEKDVYGLWISFKFWIFGVEVWRKGWYER